MTRVANTTERNLVLATDSAGVLPACVAIASAVRAKKCPGRLIINVLSYGLLPDDEKKLAHAAAGREGVELRVIDVVPVLEPFLGILKSLSGYWPLTTYARLFIDIILPAAVGNVLYIDIDTFVVDDITVLFNLDLGKNVFAAVPEADISTSNGRYERLDFSKDDPFYFNAGVIIINMDNYRLIGGQKEAMRVLHLLMDRIVTPDQDVLNFMGRGRTLELHARWNHNDGLLVKQFLFSVFSKRRYRGKRGVEVLEAILKPGILHYWGKSKPWRKNHRPERNRYCNLIRELGLSGENFGVPINTVLDNVELCFYDMVHCLLRVVARIRLAIWRLVVRG